MSILRGKGLWAYRTWELDRALQIAPEMGVTHILYKVGEGSSYIANAAALAQKIRQAKLTPVAWSYLRLNDLTAEVAMVLAAFRDGYDGFIFDMEEGSKDKHAVAAQFAQTLVDRGVAPDQLYLCSYPNITSHLNLPFVQMAPLCKGGLMPMAYGTFQRPPEVVLDQWTYRDERIWLQQQGLSLPIYPVLGPYYDEQGNKRMTQAEYQAWLDRMAVYKPTFFSLFTAATMEPAYFAPTRAFALGESPKPSGVKVEINSPEVGYLNIRSGPATTFPILTQAPHGSVLQALEPEATVKAKVGKDGQWIGVLTADGQAGYGAAAYMKLPSGPAPVVGEVKYVVVESPEYGLRVRGGPDANQPQVWWVPHGTVLESLEDPKVTAAKLGQQGQWLKVRTPARKEGYVAAWYLRAPLGPDNRTPVDDKTLPLAQSAYLFGIHAISAGDEHWYGDKIRALYAGKPHKGWIFFTEGIGSNPAAHQQVNQAVRDRYWRWAQDGYGVIVRLNHGYHPSGTLPEPQFYDAFAETCARWVELYLKHAEAPATSYLWTIQIGNEMNNPSEHPNGQTLTAALYAQAFNKVYARIKAVLPNSIITPGAIDPYNAQIARPLDYFQQMLDGITALDGFVLHAYTHGPSVEAITHLNTFGGEPLTDHYYDFQTYRLFMERIPAKWRGLPVYITETNHVCRDMSNEGGSQGWINQNIGWVRAAYAEIQRWNSTPYTQQIRALLLYRWTADQWAIDDKPAILEDFRMALDSDYRWRGGVGPVSFGLLAAPAAPAGAEAGLAFGLSFAAAEAAPAPEERLPLEADDLQQIWGIGSKTAAALRTAGIQTFAQVAAATPERLRAIIRQAGIGARGIATWPEQARLILEHRPAELAALQQRLARERATDR